MQTFDELGRKSLTVLPWMIGFGLFISTVMAFVIQVVPRGDNLWLIWGILAVLSLSFGVLTGWFWNRWGLLLPILVPVIFTSFGYLRVKGIYSPDVWPLQVLIYLVPIVPFLLLGVATGGFLRKRYRDLGDRGR